MSELLMKDVQKKFASAREVCPGMSEEIYALSDYFSAVANDTLVPAGIMMTLLGIMDDLDKGRCGFGRLTELPQYLAEHAMQARAQLPYILQVIDAIADENFADAVRSECQAVFHWNIAKRVVVTDKLDASDNINAAVNWWAETIQHPKMDNGDNQMAMLLAMFGGGRSRQYTEDDIKKFRQTLTDVLTEEMDRRGNATLSVDYTPNHLLRRAGEVIGLSQFDYPCKTVMWISATEVSVRAGYGAPEEVIWSASA